MSEVWEFTYKVVVEAESKAVALMDALQYLQEQAGQGTLEPTGAECLEEREE